MSSHNVWMTMRSYTQDRSVAGRRLGRETVRRVLGYARPYRMMITLYLVLVVISAVLSVVTPLLLQRIVDNGVLAKDTAVVVGLSLVVAVIALVDAGLTLVSRWYSSRIGEGLIYDLRTQVFDHVQRMPVAFFSRTQTGALISRLNSDVIGAQQAFTSTLSGVVSNIISLVLVVGAMLALSWQVTLASLVLLPVFLVPARFVGRRIAGLTRESFQLNAEMSSMMTERFNVSGAMLAKLFGRPEDDTRAFSGRAGRVAEIGVRIAMSNRFFFTGLTLVAALASALVYGIGGVLAVRGALTVGTLVALVALLGQLYGPLTALSNVRVDVMTALVSFERVFEVLDLQPMVRDAESAAALPRGPKTLEFDHVDFHYPTAGEVSLASLEAVATLDSTQTGQVLHGVSFRVEPGQLVALVGPSGAGKTTITSLVPRLYDVTGGAVRVGGTDIREVTLQSLRDSIGVVTQDAHMYHDTIRANLLYSAPDASDAQIESVLRAAQIWDLVASLPDGLDTVVGERGHRLSGGEKQRLAIARLLLKGPDIVVLDEATAHLDSESERLVQAALDSALHGRTSLVIAHRLSTVMHADQILVVVDGFIAERGTHAELLAHDGVYAELYRTQFDPQSRADESADGDGNGGDGDGGTPGLTRTDDLARR